MRDKAVVVSVTEKGALVTPLLTGACINCKKSSCARQGTPFLVSNPKKLPLASGTAVTLTASKTAQAFQALFALLLPIFAAVGGYLLAPQNEKSQAIMSIAGFLIASILVFAVTRLFPPQKSSIDSIADTAGSEQAETCTIL